MPMTPEAAKRYRPRRPEMTLDDVVTPAERERRARDVQEAKDMADQPKTDKAYMESLTSTEPVKKAGGGMTASARADGCAQRGRTRGKMV